MSHEPAPVKAKRQYIPTGGRPPGRSYEVTQAHQEALGNNFDGLEQELYQYRNNLDQFLNTGNKAAATRARQNMSTIIGLCGMARAGIQDARQSLIINEQSAGS
jgi:hypothetical protein